MASQGGAFSVIEARPSGAATTVSEPFSSTTAPEAAAAAWARSHFDVCFRWLAESSLNNRANSPSCGVSTVGDGPRALIAANSVSGASAKLVSASASSTTARSPTSAASTISRIGSPDPAARTEHDGVEPRIGQQRRKLRRAVDRRGP